MLDTAPAEPEVGAGTHEAGPQSHGGWAARAGLPAVSGHGRRWNARRKYTAGVSGPVLTFWTRPTRIVWSPAG